MRPLRGLFPKYSVTLMLFASVLVAGSGALEMALLWRQVQEAAAAVQRAETRAAAIRIEQFLSAIQATTAEVARLPWEGGLSPREEYHRLMKIMPAIAQLRWVGRDGRVMLTASRFAMDDATAREDAAAARLAREASGPGFAYGVPYFRDGSEPFVTLAVAHAGDGVATLAEIDLKFVVDLVRDMRVGGAGRVYVVGSRDRLIAHPNLDLVLRRTDLSAYAPVRELRSRLQGAAVAGMIAGDGLESGEVLASAASIPSARWIVVAEQPRGEVLQPVYDALLTTAALLLAALLAALLVSYGIARRLAGPIVALRHGAERIARGELETRMDVRTGDEVEALARQLNAMAEQLQDYTGGLQRKVDEKTRELKEALGLAHDAIRAKAVFLAAASHDLRQPLYAISILADTLGSEPLPPQAAAVLEKQRQAIAVLRGLFDDILDLSRFDAREVRPVLRPVALRELLAPCVLEHEVVSHAKGLRFESEVADAWVQTDPELVRRMVGNLLANAVRYTSAGRGAIRAAVHGEHAVIEVSDTGRGIPAEEQARVFEEFVQLENPAREREKGVGLGLSIVKRISDLLGLDLRLVSRPGEGTRVTFRVPLATRVDDAAAAGELSNAAAGAFAGARVWIVEDDPLVRDALSMQFNAWGARPAFAASAAELLALREADGRWPDAVILDDMLGSGEQGLEIAMRLREFLDDQRIVLVTGNVDPERTERLERSGLVVLRKPLTSADLAEWLREAIAAVPAAG